MENAILETTPRRIQRRRTKGWLMPDKSHAKYVGRPTMWGNPFKGADAVERYRLALDQLGQEQLDALLVPLTGLDLVCWCPIISRGAYVLCHADVLLSFDNDISIDEVIRENTRRERHADVLLEYANA